MRAILRCGRRAAWVLVAVMILGAPLALQAQDQTLASNVQIPRGVLANGQPLPAGTYTIRLSAEPVTPVVGQSEDSARWVEFVQNGQVRGKELATVVAPADVKVVAKRTPPAQGRGLVQLLRGDEYVRIWVNHEGTQYLIHLARAAS